jgi:hypothetical protein
MVIQILICPYGHEKVYYDTTTRKHLYICSQCEEVLISWRLFNINFIIEVTLIIIIAPIIGLSLFLYWLSNRSFKGFWE